MKLYDITAVTGEYTDANGNTKKSYVNVGAMMEGNDGIPYLLIDRHINFAGLPNPQGRSNVILNCFQPRQRGNNGGGYQNGNGQRGNGGGYQNGNGGGYQNRGGYDQSPQQNAGGGRPMGDEVPFAPEVRI